MIRSLLLSFGVTVFAELFVAVLLGLRDRRSLCLIFLVNVVTNPVVVYLLNLQALCGMPMLRIPLTAVLEVSAVIVEAVLYRFALKADRNPWILALILNAASYFTGVAVNIILRLVLL